MPTLVVHQSVATIAREGSAKAADELGGQSYYNAEISVDGEPRGVLFGELRTVRVYEGDEGGAWDRQGIATFRFTGGTGEFAGAHGEVESVRSEDGTFTHTFSL